MSYQLILCDPPWQYDNAASRAAAENHYPTMTLRDMFRLPVEELAADNAVLAMWYTGTHVDEAKALAAAWGFKVKNIKLFTWVKLNGQAARSIDKALHEQQLVDHHDFFNLMNRMTKIGMGNYTRSNTEDVLVAVKGNGLERVSAAVKQTVYTCIGEHSAKPYEVRRRLEELYGDVKRIELFSRGDAEGWDHWGNECPRNSVELIPAQFVPANDNQQDPACMVCGGAHSEERHHSEDIGGAQ